MDGSRRPKSRPGPTQEAQKPAKTLYCRRFFLVSAERDPRATESAPGGAQEHPREPKDPRAVKEKTRQPKRRQEPRRGPGGPEIR